MLAWFSFVVGVNEELERFLMLLHRRWREFSGPNWLLAMEHPRGGDVPYAMNLRLTSCLPSLMCCLAVDATACAGPIGSESELDDVLTHSSEPEAPHEFDFPFEEWPAREPRPVHGAQLASSIIYAGHGVWSVDVIGFEDSTSCTAYRDPDHVKLELYFARGTAEIVSYGGADSRRCLADPRKWFLSMTDTERNRAWVVETTKKLKDPIERTALVETMCPRERETLHTFAWPDETSDSDALSQKRVNAAREWLRDWSLLDAELPCQAHGSRHTTMALLEDAAVLGAVVSEIPPRFEEATGPPLDLSTIERARSFTSTAARTRVRSRHGPIVSLKLEPGRAGELRYSSGPAGTDPPRLVDWMERMLAAGCDDSEALFPGVAPEKQSVEGR